MISIGGSVDDATLYSIGGTGEGMEEVCSCDRLVRTQEQTFEIVNPHGPRGQAFDASRMRGDVAVWSGSTEYGVLRGVRESEDPSPVPSNRWRGTFDSIE